MVAGWLPDTVTADDLPLLDVDECSPFEGGIANPFFEREAAAGLW